MTPEQLLERNKYLGGSEISVIMNKSPYTSPYQLWQTKKSTELEEKSSRFMDAGNRLEPIVCKWFQDEIQKKQGFEDLTESGGTLKLSSYKNWTVKEDLNPDGTQHYFVDGFKRASLDRLIYDGDKVIGFLEAKTASESKSKLWDNTVPEDYINQVHWYMGLTGLDLCYIAVLIGGNDFKFYKIERDHQLIEDLFNFADDWWEKHIINGEAPEFTALDNKSLDGMFTMVDTQKCLDESVNDLLKHYEFINDNIKQLDKEKKDTQAILKGLLCESKYGVTDEFKVSWSRFTKPAFYVKESESSLLNVTRLKK